jgi:hypothetical protein
LYTSCLFCHTDLGANHFLTAFPVGRRLAFDPKTGRLWVICTRCGRWNLTPLEERWEAIDDSERLFRGTRLRMSTDNVGLAQFRGGFELVRVGPALLPEIASWRYGTRLVRLGDPEGYFTRVASLAMRTSWGRYPDETAQVEGAPAGSFSERLALQLANRSFWGRGGTGSDPQTPLFRLPAADRLALEMAANEDIERRAMKGELESLHAAWKDADELFADDVLDEFKRQYYDRIAAGDASSIEREGAVSGGRVPPSRFGSRRRWPSPD